MNIVSWQVYLAHHDEETLRDLCLFLNDKAIFDTMNKEELISFLCNGKKRFLFKLMDRQAFKTIRRLVRYPHRSLNYRYFEVDQLLMLGIIEEDFTKGDSNAHAGYYRIREEARDVTALIARSRHYDTMVNTWECFDQVIMGLFHTFGILEVSQLRYMLEEYGLYYHEEQLFRSISWRLAIREDLVAFQLRGKREQRRFIMLRDIDFFEAYEHIHICEEAYDLPPVDILKQRMNRYYALSYPEIKAFIHQLQKVFSRRFSRDSAKELIDMYQYHCDSFAKEPLIYRVIKKELITPYLHQARDCLEDIYCKGHKKRNQEA